MKKRTDAAFITVLHKRRWTEPVKGGVIAAALSIMFMASPAIPSPDNYPVSAGGTQPYSLGGIPFDGAFGNPALVGINRLPRHGMSFMPSSFALWSDKMAPPFNRELLMSPTNVERAVSVYLTSLFEKSFGVSTDMTPEEVSEILTREMRGGIGLYAGTRTSPFVFATRGFAFNVTTTTDIDLRVPEGFLLPVFSETGGLLVGNTLDLSDLNVDAIWTTQAAVKLGFSTVIPALRDHLKLDKGAIGAGVKLILGHSYLKMEPSKEYPNVIVYDSITGTIKADAAVDVISIGSGFNGNFDFNRSLITDKLISGQGWGLDLGAVFYNEKHFISIDMQDFGMIFWDGKQMYKGTLILDSKLGSLDLEDLFRTDDSLALAYKYMITWLPTALNAGYSYYHDISKDNNLKFFMGYLSASAGYRQQIILGPGNSTYSPRFSAGGTLGLLDGYLPLRCGVILGGTEGLASVIGIGLDIKYVSVDLSYKAVGSPILVSKRGFEAAGAVNFRWGWKMPRRLVRIPQDAADHTAAPEKQQTEEPSTDDPPLPELDESTDDWGNLTEDEELVDIEPLDADTAEVVWFAEEKPAVDSVIAAVEHAVHEETKTQADTLQAAVPEPTALEEQALAALQRAINFRQGSANLTRSSFAALDVIAVALRKYPHIRYEIQGHTDSYGGAMLNLLLSAERAAVVRNYLVSKGAPIESLVAIGHGSNRPIADNRTARGRTLNRRVELSRIFSQDEFDRLKRLEQEIARGLSR